MPIGLETSSRPSPVTSRPSDLTISFETIPVTSTARPNAGNDPEALPVEAEAEAIAAVDELWRDRAELLLLAVAPTVIVTRMPSESPMVCAISSASRVRRRSRRSGRPPAARLPAPGDAMSGLELGRDVVDLASPVRRRS